MTGPRTALGVLLLGASGAALTLGACAPKVDYKDVERSEITLEEVRALVESDDPKAALVLDARTPRNFRAGHIPGARQMPSYLFSGRRGETDPKLEEYGTIVVYADNRGSDAAGGLSQAMMSTGYTNVRTFFDGLDAWRRAGRPVETGEAARDGQRGN